MNVLASVAAFYKEGGMFMHYYAESSCTAGRCAFVTGMHPYRAGMLWRHDAL